MTVPRPLHSDVTVTRETGVAGLNPAEERDHLRREHGLTRVDAWVAVAVVGENDAATRDRSARRHYRLRRY
jgi:hypothetical protein